MKAVDVGVGGRGGHLGDVGEGVAAPLRVLDAALTGAGGAEGITALLTAGLLQLPQVRLVVPELVVEGPDERLEARPGLVVLEVVAVLCLVGRLSNRAHPGVSVALLHLGLRADFSPDDFPAGVVHHGLFDDSEHFHQAGKN